MRQRTLIELLEGMAYAALAVVDAWSAGDLAGAVNDLEHDAKVVRKALAIHRQQLKKIRRRKKQ
jgi:hypothetical protein